MIITIEKGLYYIDGSVIFDDIDMSINKGDKIGIVGRNGSGKSTLLNVLAGKLDLSGGKRIAKPDITIVLVKQELPDPSQTPLEFLRNNDGELQALYKKADNADAHNIGDIYDQISYIEDERYEKNAPTILRGLGINPQQQNEPIANLAGGLRMRLVLASALLRSPDILLLDEPTNHLDLRAVFWLTEFLKHYSKPYVIVSHDQTLLNAVTNKIYHLQYATLTPYAGNYDTFINQYRLKQKQAEEVNDKMDEKAVKSEQFIAKFKAKPKWAKIAKTRERQLARDEASRPLRIIDPPKIPIAFPECAELKDPIFEANKVVLGYAAPILNNVNLSIQHNDRIGILGNNGQGKSTLVKFITDHLKPLIGDVRKDPRLKIGYFSQDQMDVLEPELTLYEQYKLLFNDAKNEQIKASLGHFGFDEISFQTKVKDLSGGERSRLLLAIIIGQKPQLIVLDEPTNHLDIEAKDSLCHAINIFNGAVVIVSHDWDLLAKTTKDYWVVNQGKLLPYKGGLEQYTKAAMAHIADLMSGKSVTKKMHGLALLSNKSENAKAPESKPDNPTHKHNCLK